jgi:hypothetical protein
VNSMEETLLKLNYCPNDVQEFGLGARLVVEESFQIIIIWLCA